MGHIWYASSVLEKDLMVSLTLWRLELDWNMATEESPLFQETVLWEGAGMECGSPEWESVSLGVVRISVGLCGRPHGHWGPWMMPFDPTNRKDTSGTCSQDRKESPLCILSHNLTFSCQQDDWQADLWMISSPRILRRNSTVFILINEGRLAGLMGLGASYVIYSYNAIKVTWSSDHVISLH